MTNKQTLFISYCRKDGADYADELEMQLRDEFEVLRDKSTVKDNDDIYGFMSDIANCDNVIIILTDEYTKSLNCMLEMAFLFQQEDWKLKVTVLVIDESIYTLQRKLEILTYWHMAQMRISSENPGFGEHLIEEEKRYVDDICAQLEKFLMGVAKRKNPSQIAVVNTVIRNARSKDVQLRRERTRQLGEQTVAKILSDFDSLSISEIAEKSGKSFAMTRRILQSLMAQGKVRKDIGERIEEYRKTHN